MNPGHFYHSARALSAALHERDSHTRHHCDRVGRLARIIGQEMALPGAELSILEVCGQYHDIGKIGVPDAILFKSTSFTREDWVSMRAHPEIGERIIRETEVPGCDKAAAIVRHHHENYAGDGYPDGLEGEAIPLHSRAIFVVDAYDALRATRVYRPARSHHEAMEILESEVGWKFDPRVFATFKRCIGRVPYAAEEGSRTA